jgi:hypothetical protein
VFSEGSHRLQRALLHQSDHRRRRQHRTCRSQVRRPLSPRSPAPLSGAWFPLGSPLPCPTPPDLLLSPCSSRCRTRASDAATRARSSHTRALHFVAPRLDVGAGDKRAAERTRGGGRERGLATLVRRGQHAAARSSARRPPPARRRPRRHGPRTASHRGDRPLTIRPLACAAPAARRSSRPGYGRLPLRPPPPPARSHRAPGSHRRRRHRGHQRRHRRPPPYLRASPRSVRGLPAASPDRARAASRRLQPPRPSSSTSASAKRSADSPTGPIRPRPISRQLQVELTGSISSVIGQS